MMITWAPVGTLKAFNGHAKFSSACSLFRLHLHTHAYFILYHYFDMYRLVGSSMRKPPALKLCAPALLHELDHDTADGTVVAEVCAAVSAFAGTQGKDEWE